jgi:gluconolactonase
MAWSFERVYGPEGTEAGGVVWDGTGVLFSLPAAERILRFEPGSGSVTEFRRYAGYVHGLAVGPQGQVYGCQTSSRRLVRFGADGSTSVLPYRLGGRVQNFPHDLAVDSSGRIWFSDPHSRMRTQGPNAFPLLDHASVLRLDPVPGRGWEMRRMTFDTLAPDAVCLSADEGTLFVSERASSPSGCDELRAYPVEGDELGPPTVIHRFGGGPRGPHRGVRGMCVDGAGRIVACAGSAAGGPGPLVYVFEPSGRPVAAEPAPADPVACAFGGPDRQTLYVTTTRGELYRVEGAGSRG